MSMQNFIGVPIHLRKKTLYIRSTNDIDYLVLNEDDESFTTKGFWIYVHLKSGRVEADQIPYEYDVEGISRKKALKEAEDIIANIQKILPENHTEEKDPQVDYFQNFKNQGYL